MSSAARGIRQWCRRPRAGDIRDARKTARDTKEKPMDATTRNAEMRASDADRDAVLSALSEHFQAGRLTADELDERTGQALAARTWGELKALLADLPATSSAPRAAAGPSSGAGPRPGSRRAAPPFTLGLAAIG